MLTELIREDIFYSAKKRILEKKVRHTLYSTLLYPRQVYLFCKREKKHTFSMRTETNKLQQTFLNSHFTKQLLRAFIVQM